LVQFKNLKSIDVHFDLRVNCFVGRNGAGKTNMLDAIHSLCFGKSHFLNKDEHLIMQGTEFSRVEAWFENEFLQQTEHIVLKIPSQGRKSLERNGVPYAKLSEHLGLIPLIMVVPSDTELIQGQSEERRRYFDSILCQLDLQYAFKLNEYQKVLKQRNAYLKMHGPNISTVNYDLINSYNLQLTGFGQFIFEARRELLTNLEEEILDYFRLISGEIGKLSFNYESQLEEGYQSLLDQSLAKDLILGRTTVGIHRDDIHLSLDDKDLKQFGSQGQIKSVLFSMLLAAYTYIQHKLKKSPILVLDDLFDKLDMYRVKHLLEIIQHKNIGQVFISDTTTDRLERLLIETNSEYRIFHFDNGEVIL